MVRSMKTSIALGLVLLVVLLFFSACQRKREAADNFFLPKKGDRYGAMDLGSFKHLLPHAIENKASWLNHPLQVVLFTMPRGLRAENIQYKLKFNAPFFDVAHVYMGASGLEGKGELKRKMRFLLTQRKNGHWMVDKAEEAVLCKSNQFKGKDFHPPPCTHLPSGE